MMGAGVTIVIRRALPENAPAVATLVGELLHEIMSAIGERAFSFDPAATTLRTRDFLAREKYFVFLATDEKSGAEVGFVALCESYALYAEGCYGTIPELYVRSGHRSQGIGERLLGEARGFGRRRGWKRLEVTTPPLPQFERALRFYEREGFRITGGRKLRIAL